MIHDLNILPKYFEAVKRGDKTFELRKDDRGFEVGDTVILHEFHIHSGIRSGRTFERKISYILRDCAEYGLAKGFCILGLEQEPVIDKIGDEIRHLPFKPYEGRDTLDRSEVVEILNRYKSK